VGIELLERAARAGGRILRAEQLAQEEGQRIDPQRGAGFLLTFDVGRVLVQPGVDGQSLDLVHVEDPAEMKVARAPLDEEEPWWRLLGNPITRAWQGAGEAMSAEAPVDDLRMQFRHDHENPMVVRMHLEPGRVVVSLEPTHGG